MGGDLFITPTKRMVGLATASAERWLVPMSGRSDRFFLQAKKTCNRLLVCTENLIRVDDVVESPKLAE